MKEKLNKVMSIIKEFIVKQYKLLIPIVIIIVIVIIIGIIFRRKPVTPILDKIELGDYSKDITNPYTFVKSNLGLGYCTIESNIDINKVGKYKYSIVCPDKTYGPYKVKVVDTVPPTVILKNMLITPTKDLKPEDYFLYVNDLSNYHIKILNPQDFDTNSMGAYDVHIRVSDDYGNYGELTTVLTVSEDAPIKTLVCNNLKKVGVVPSNYYIYINKDDKISNVLRVTHFKYDNRDYYNEDVKHYRKHKLISGIDGDIVIKDMDITFYKYIYDINYKDEFNIKFIPENKNDILKVFNNSCKEV